MPTAHLLPAHSENILNYSGGKYTFNKPTVTSYKSTACTWQMLLSAKLSF